MNKKENVLVIGNGFDLYHFLPTRYVDFLKTINRLIELENEGRLEQCQYIKYLWGPGSPIFQQDEYIQKCYEVHTQKMQSVELNRDRIRELVKISKNNAWIKYFQSCLEKDIRWIDFEKEIGNVLSAIQKLFLLDNKANDLVNGIVFEHLLSLDLKTIDILEHLPFVVYSDIVFYLKEEYCKKGIGNEYYIGIDKEKIFEKLEQDLGRLAKALCIYLKEFVQKIAIDKSADNPVFYNIDKVLNFNYTDTYRKLYDSKVEIKFIHGNINNEENGIVLGVNNDTKDELQEMDTSLIRFKKYYQRAIKETFYSVEDFLDDETVQYQVAIVGHSIDMTDRDVLVGLMDHPRSKLTIYYHNEKAHGEQVVNFISLVGKSRFDELRNQKKVIFSPLKEYNESLSGMDGQMVEKESYKYELKHEYRFLEAADEHSSTVLIGNEIVQVSARDNKVGVNEIKLVDYFLDLQEYYNHSGLYKGIVKLVSLFNDDRNCTAGASIKYIKANKESEDNISEIRALFETECEGVLICISDVDTMESYV